MPGGFQDLVEDLFGAIDAVSFRKMFGGVGIFRDGVMFALIADDTLYLKADETTRGRYEAEGCAPFVYEGKGRVVSMGYWQVPERLYDDPDDFREWGLAAFEVAERARRKKPVKKRSARRGAGDRGPA